MFEYKIIKKIGVAGENRNDTKEINIIKWSDNAPCIDVRRWRNGKPLKGIAFYPDEIDELIKLLKKAKKEVIWATASTEEFLTSTRQFLCRAEASLYA